mmetsp:Transcript_19949/g.56513  ORF Transcript_19949/g.56513 Transcript_19949/m.56513 type:complete len:244 (+) Transcript_19949:1129-1860(+)
MMWLAHGTCWMTTRIHASVHDEDWHRVLWIWIDLKNAIVASYCCHHGVHVKHCDRCSCLCCCRCCHGFHPSTVRSYPMTLPTRRSGGCALWCHDDSVIVAGCCCRRRHDDCCCRYLRHRTIEIEIVVHAILDHRCRRIDLDCAVRHRPDETMPNSHGLPHRQNRDHLAAAGCAAVVFVGCSVVTMTTSIRWTVTMERRTSHHRSSSDCQRNCSVTAAVVARMSTRMHSMMIDAWIAWTPAVAA